MGPATGCTGGLEKGFGVTAGIFCWLGDSSNLGCVGDMHSSPSRNNPPPPPKNMPKTASDTKKLSRRALPGIAAGDYIEVLWPAGKKGT